MRLEQMSPGERMRTYVAFELAHGRAPIEALANNLCGQAVRVVWHDPEQRAILANLMLALAHALDPDSEKSGRLRH
jgi:hypothetical protein